MNLGEEPKTVLVRPRHIYKWLGISSQEFHKCVRAGLVPFKVINKNGRKWYRTEDIKRIFVEGFK